MVLSSGLPVRLPEPPALVLVGFTQPLPPFLNLQCSRLVYKDSCYYDHAVISLQILGTNVYVHSQEIQAKNYAANA